MPTPNSEYVKARKDSIAQRLARLDQAQAALDANHHKLDEIEAWENQAAIDVMRFDLELEKLILKVRFPSD